MKLLKLIKPTHKTSDRKGQARVFEGLIKKTGKTVNYIGDVGKKKR